MNVIVIGSLSSGTKNDPKVIAEHLANQNIKVNLLYWEQLLFSIQTGSVVISQNDQDIFDQKIDLIIAVGWYKNGTDSVYRDVAYAFAQVAGSKNIPMWNSEMGMQRSTSKLSCLVQLALENVPVPRTHFSLDNTLSLDNEPLPFVAKSPSASRGRANYFVKDESEKSDLFLDRDNRYLVQPFMPNDHDLRVICFAGKPHLVLRRSRQDGADTHLNNTSQNGKSEWIDMSQLPVDLLTECEKICKIMGREMAGIDFIPDQESSFGYSCLEVNAVPQLTSGVDVDTKMNSLTQAIMSFGDRRQI